MDVLTCLTNTTVNNFTSLARIHSQTVQYKQCSNSRQPTAVSIICATTHQIYYIKILWIGSLCLPKGCIYTPRTVHILSTFTVTVTVTRRVRINSARHCTNSMWSPYFYFIYKSALFYHSLVSFVRDLQPITTYFTNPKPIFDWPQFSEEKKFFFIKR